MPLSAARSRTKEAPMRTLLPPLHRRLFPCLLFTLVLCGQVPPLSAFNLFNSENREPSPQPPASSGAGQLPSLAAVARSAMPAVVNISTTQRLSHRRSASPPAPSPFGERDPREDFFRHFFGEQGQLPPREQRSLGSGFIVSQDGYIVTNKHVIGSAGATITVHL